MTRYPKIEFDLNFNDRLIDVIAEGVDAAIRSGDMGNSQLKARPLGTFRFILVGAPPYFASCGVPRVPTDLANHACLRYKFPTTGQLQEWQFDAEQAGATRIPVPGTHAFNSVETLISASMAGLGIAYLPDFAVREAIGTGTLMPVLFHSHSMVAGGLEEMS